MLALFFATAVSIIGFFRRRPDIHVGPWRAVFAPGIAALGFLAVILQATVGRAELFGTSTLGTIFIAVPLILALVGAAYAAWLRGRKPEVFARIGDQDDVVIK